MSDEGDLAEWHYGVGVEHMRREEWSLATQAFRSAIRLDPQRQPAHAGLGAALGHQRLWRLAVEAHTAALRLEPDDVDVQYNLAVAYAELERPVEAERGFRDVLRRRPGDHETLVRLGTALAEQERLDEALEQLQLVASLEPPSDHTAFACAYAAALLVGLGQTKEARISLERARRLNPALFAARPDFERLWTDLNGV
jgi:cytochrome c-type biogenesis protein CcmH/NrfG